MKHALCADTRTAVDVLADRENEMLGMTDERKVRFVGAILFSLEKMRAGKSIDMDKLLRSGYMDKVTNLAEELGVDGSEVVVELGTSIELAAIEQSETNDFSVAYLNGALLSFAYGMAGLEDGYDLLMDAGEIAEACSDLAVRFE